MKQTLIGLVLCAILVWGAWQQRSAQPDPSVTQRELFALGTLIQISIAGQPDPSVMQQVQAQLTELERRWSVFGDGELAQLNQQLIANTRVSLPAVLRPGFVAAQKLCRNSGGRFDPGVGQLVQLWGFDDEDHFRDSPPAQAEIDAALAQRSSLCEAELGADSLQVPRAHARFDFGASAKGRAVDEAIDLLRRLGIHNAIVNAGGDIKVIGQRPDRAWRIGIRHPRPDQGQIMFASLEVGDGEAIFTSGDYERYFIHDGQRYHHILDPRSGYPTRTSQSATVIHNSAELADAAATALFVAGAKDAAAVMQAMGIETWLLIDATGTQHASASMRTRLSPADAP